MRLDNVGLASILALCTAVEAVANIPDVSATLSTSLLSRRGGCSGGVAVCCGSSSVGCGGGVCKACCGSDCGCFYERGGTCSSDPSVTPCVNPDDPDFPTTNGECVAPTTTPPPSGGGGGGQKGGKCRKLLKKYESCLQENMFNL